MSQENQNNSRMCWIEWDGFHHWEKYLVTYDQALSLIPVVLNKVPSITLTDYELSKIQGEDDQQTANPSTIKITDAKGSI